MQGETLKVNPQLPSCGSWRLDREIGHGAYGVVYLAVAPDGERAAVKVCRRDAVDPERYSRELRGAKLYRAIPPQEGLVRMRTLAETEWGFYAVMDLADDEFGGPQEASSGYRPKTLARVIEGEKALPLKECVKLGIALAGGLATLQRHHLLHRDIKPANVIYIGGKPVLSDPGLLVEESDAVSLVGTPGYVPPEKFTDAASDVYSLGLTLKAASFGRQIEDIDKGPALEADTGAKLFPAWWRILNKATDPAPSRRYQSAKALARDLKLLGVRLFFSSRNSRKTLIVVFLAKFLLVALVLAVALLYLGRSNAQNGRKRDNAANARAATVYERALRENFGDILSEEQIKEKSRKAAAGEDIGLAPAETKAYMKKLGLDKIKTDLKELSEKLERNLKDSAE